jgi:DNA polymerase-1
MLTISKEDSAKIDWAKADIYDLAEGNAADCKFTCKIYNTLFKDFENAKIRPFYDKILKQVILDFGVIEYNGIHVDVDYIKELDETLIKVITSLKKECDELSPIGPVHLKGQDLIGLLFLEEGFDLTPKKFTTTTKLPSTAAEDLEDLADDILDKKNPTEKELTAEKFIRKYLEWTYRSKQHDTYVKNIYKAIEYNSYPRVHPQYNFSTVVTGRLSCSNYSFKVKEKDEKGKEKQVKKLKGVSFHTLPRQDEGEVDLVNIRKLFVPQPGYFFITADLNAAEVRMMAFASQDKSLIKAFYADEDLHKYTASLIFKKTIEQISKKERQIAKSVTFLLLYGGGPKKLAAQIGESLSYAKLIFSKYEDAFPTVFKWIKKERERIKEYQVATSIFGRERHLPNVKSPSVGYQERALRQGINHLIQSPVSDYLLACSRKAVLLGEQMNVKFNFLASVHDSLEIQTDEKNLEKTLMIIKYSLTDLKQFEQFGVFFNVPFKADLEVGRSFGDGIKVEFNGNKVSNMTEVMKYFD